MLPLLLAASSASYCACIQPAFSDFIPPLLLLGRPDFSASAIPAAKADIHVITPLGKSRQVAIVARAEGELGYAAGNRIQGRQRLWFGRFASLGLDLGFTLLVAFHAGWVLWSGGDKGQAKPGTALPTELQRCNLWQGSNLRHV